MDDRLSGDDAGAVGPRWFDKEEALLAVDAFIAQALTLKAILQNTYDGVPEKPKRVCMKSESGQHESILWDKDPVDGVLLGMCRLCGDEVRRAYDPGVSDEEPDEPES